MAKLGESPTTPTFDCEAKPISGWDCILMTYIATVAGAKTLIYV
jgi:hypothetical protein